MKLHFEVEDQIHTFNITEEINSQDLKIIKIALSRFFESKPSFVIIDFSLAQLTATHHDLQTLILELKTIALSLQITFYVAQTDIESLYAKKNITEIALTRQLKILQNKVELREKIQRHAEELIKENESLKSNIQNHFERMNDIQPTALAKKLNPMLEKLWSDKK